jgi:hypothetical protein
MRYLLLVSSLALVTLVAIAPPGLCPCWLLREPERVHPHLDGWPERPHRHEYLFSLFQSQAAAAAPVAVLPAGLLLLCQALAAVWRRIPEPIFPARGWSFSPLTPPPRS